ncbi:MAG: putative porin, partial [Prevotella sp.]|nr:putative porin [Prevotella sp.]
IARVLLVELGSCATFFTKYEAPDYLPQLSVFAVQQNADSRVKLGGYPFVDVYANMHLKRARFFVSMSHVNAGSGSKDYFLAPHYPTNTRILRMGVSWNFYN